MTKQKKKSSIVLVDDEAAALRTMETALRIEGFDSVEMFDSWKKAAKSIDPESTDAILLDIIMPDISGLDALRECRNCYPQIPVIMVTAVNDVEKAVTCMKSGAADYLTKPLNINRFIECINNVLIVDALEKEEAIVKKNPGINHGTIPYTATEKLVSLDKVLGSILKADLSGVSDKDLQMLQLFENIMHEQKMFLDPDIALDIVAERMNTNIVYARKLLKKAYNVNFRLYVNALRISEFIQLTRSDESVLLSIEGLCRSVGFTRRATFYEAFKAITGSTPGLWLEKITAL